MIPEPHLFPGDLIAVHINGALSFHARVEEILPDVKPGWRRMRFLALTIPRREITWILEPKQLDGEEFSMGGTPVRIERLPEPAPADPFDAAPDASSSDDPKGKIISFPFPKGKK